MIDAARAAGPGVIALLALILGPIPFFRWRDRRAERQAGR